METRTQKGRRGSTKGKRTSGELKEKLSVFEQIQEVAYQDARATSGEKHFLLFLMSWWSDKYNRPLKDPVLASYTLEELSYEYCLHLERRKAEKERADEENDKIEEAKLQAADEWADKMEDEEESGEETPRKYVNPMEDPKMQKWMADEIAKDKQEFGEDFGDDFNIDF